MTIYFANRCRHIIIINIDDGNTERLQPFETKPINRNDSDIIKVSVKRNCESTRNSSVYNLVIETEYIFSDIYDGTSFTITREKIQFSLNASYDRLFLKEPNAGCISEKFNIISEDKIKKAFNKSRRLEFVFDTILASIELIIILLIIGIVLTFIWGWRIAVVYFPLAILFVGVYNWLADKFCDVFFKKAFKADDEKTEFYKYFNNDFIKDYYSDMNRIPFYGRLETD